jgi:serine/threonine-protein kinase
VKHVATHDRGSALGPAHVGAVLGGRYRLDGIRGAGGMGTVFRATDLRLGCTVAVKVASAVATRRHGGAERFMREGQIATQLQSEHVAHVSDMGVLPNGLPWLVMEWLEGTDLAALLRRSGPMCMETAVDCVVQACEALADVHRQGFIHRDLKPSNLFLVRAPDGAARVKLIDFGVAKALGGEGEVPRITQSGSVVGTPHYMSPEQMGLSETDGRADVWSLGVVLFELLTGALPFEGVTLNDLLTAILVHPRVKASELEPRVPDELDEIIAQCLDAEPTRRFPDVVSLATALRAFGPGSAPRWSSPSQRRLAARAPSPFAEQSTLATPGSFSQWLVRKRRTAILAAVCALAVALGLACASDFH